MLTMPNENGWTLLHHASARGELQEVKRLLTAGADIDATTSRRTTFNGNYKSTTLHNAALFGFVDVVQIYIDAEDGYR